MRPDQASVLIVDDYSDMREIIKATLMTLPVKSIFEAEDGLEALDILEKQSINCVISDWRMPRLDGLGLLIKLRSDPSYLGISFMMMTGDVSRENIQEAISVGVDAFLAKPFSTTAVAEKAALIAEKAYLPSNRFCYQSRDLDQDAGKETLLLASDSDVLTRQMNDKLQDSYQVTVAQSGVSALQIAKINPLPALILLDDQVPEMNSLMVCHHLSSDPITADIPIIQLSEQLDDEAIVAALKAGAADCLAKTASADLLKIKIHNLLNQHRDGDKRTQQVRFLMKTVMGLPVK